jgi:hypothetical protein
MAHSRLKKQGVTDTAILHQPHLLGGTYYDEIDTYVDGEPTLDAALARSRYGLRQHRRYANFAGTLTICAPTTSFTFQPKPLAVP